MMIIKRVMKGYVYISVAFLLLASGCTTRKCLNCECRRSSLIGCTNPYGTSTRNQNFCEGEDGVVADKLREIEERMIDNEWICTNN